MFVSTGQFDHITFPGPVPRSFVGPGLVAGLVYPALAGLRTLVPELDQAKAAILVQSISKQDLNMNIPVHLVN